MDENIVIQRGKKAGNVLLLQTCVIVVLYILTIVGDSNSSDIQSDLIVGSYSWDYWYIIFIYPHKAFKKR